MACFLCLICSILTATFNSELFQTAERNMIVLSMTLDRCSLNFSKYRFTNDDDYFDVLGNSNYHYLKAVGTPWTLVYDSYGHFVTTALHSRSLTEVLSRQNLMGRWEARAVAIGRPFWNLNDWPQTDPWPLCPNIYPYTVDIDRDHLVYSFGPFCIPIYYTYAGVGPFLALVRTCPYPADKDGVANQGRAAFGGKLLIQVDEDRMLAMSWDRLSIAVAVWQRQPE